MLQNVQKKRAQFLYEHPAIPLVDFLLWQWKCPLHWGQRCVLLNVSFCKVFWESQWNAEDKEERWWEKYRRQPTEELLIPLKVMANNGLPCNLLKKNHNSQSLLSVLCGWHNLLLGLLTNNIFHLDVWHKADLTSMKPNEEIFMKFGRIFLDHVTVWNFQESDFCTKDVFSWALLSSKHRLPSMFLSLFLQHVIGNMALLKADLISPGASGSTL
jgi:hypothetical protein